MGARRQARDARRLRSRKIRAVLTAGLVLGVGATATLAAWTDVEAGTATFTAGRFDIVGATDGVTFTQHPVGAPATLSFAVAPTAMMPGVTTYALFSVKTVNPSVAGVVQVMAGTPSGTGLAAHLTYGVRTIAGTVCDATAFNAGTVVVASGSALTASAPTSQALSANGASQVNYCIAVTLPSSAPNAAQGLNATQTWQFTGATT